MLCINVFLYNVDVMSLGLIIYISIHVLYNLVQFRSYTFVKYQERIVLFLPNNNISSALGNLLLCCKLIKYMVDEFL